MRAIIPTLLLVVVGITPERAMTQELAESDTIMIRPTRSAVPERQWGVEQPHRSWTEATVVRITQDTLWYLAGAEVEKLAVQNAEVRRATGRNHRVSGAILGGVASAVVVGVVAYSTFKPEYGYSSIGASLVCALNDCPPPPQTNSRAVQTVGGALTGALAGGLLGYFIGREVGRWESVELVPAVAPGGTVSMRLRLGA